MMILRLSTVAPQLAQSPHKCSIFRTIKVSRSRGRSTIRFFIVMVLNTALLYTLIKGSNSSRIPSIKESTMDSQEDTIAVRAGENFDPEKVEHYLRDHIKDIGEGTLQVRQFSSGAS